MWLINTSTLDLKEFSGPRVPKYAILSHTWGEEEVLFHDMPQSRTNTGQEARLPEGSRKRGYAKVKNTCIKARELHYDYVWVDTCCIDKSVEQMEEINSMFRYYEEAGICLAYLSDVSPESDSILDALASARWFTRGWTLQELLAPWNITFYASDWSEIGTRTTISRYIERITGIDRKYLWDKVGYITRFNLLREASVAQRMTWAVGRNTTKPEDIAYCLLGIFGIHMSLMYGEGSRAFIRLQEHIIAKYSDATLLAWNARTITGSEIIPPEEPEDPSRWRAAWNMLTWKEHPWGSLEHRAANLTPSLSLLAPSPDYFLGCHDVVAHSIFFDWSLIANGISGVGKTSF
ncbi:HET domain-containing protein [Apiospora arundinis]